MNNSPYKYPIFCLFVFLFACAKEKTSWEMDVVSPLAYANLTLADLVKEDYLSDSSEAMAVVRFSDTVYQTDFTDLLVLPDTVFSFAYTFPFFMEVLPSNSFIQLGDSVRLNVPDANFDQLRIRSGKMRYELVSSLKGSVDMEYEMPAASLKGVPLSLVVNIPAATDALVSLAGELDLSGYVLDMSQTSSNSLYTFVRALNHSASDTLFITLDDSVQLHISFDDLIPDFAQGYFGQSSFALEDPSVSIGVFGNIIGGSLDLERAALSLKLINSMGVDAQWQLLEFVASHKEETLILNQTVLKEAVFVQRAALLSDNPPDIMPSVTEVALDEATATAFFNLLPQQLAYHLSMQINPNGDVSGGKDFYAFGNGFAAIMDMEVPLQLGLKGLTVRDTVALTENNDIFHQIDAATFRLIADNTFPLEAKLQLYLINKHGNVEDTLVIEQPVLAGGDVGGEPRSQRTILEVACDLDRLDNFYNTQQICVEAVLDTKEGERPVLQTAHYLKLKFIAEVTTTVNK